jgi:hypothetical protein
MEIQITIDDPKVYTKPWQVKEQVRLVRITTSSRAPVRTISTFGTWEGNSAGNRRVLRAMPCF